MMNEWIISSSILIGAVLLLRFALRGRISLRLQYALWAVVLLRLLLPVQIFTSDFGAGSIAKEVNVSAPVQQVYASAREDDYERAYDAAYSQVVAEYLAISQTYDPVVVEQEAAAQAKQTIELDLQGLLKRVWLAGMGVMTAVIAACNLHLSRQLRRRRYALDIADCLLPVYITDAVPTPCIFGFFQPAIYLTPEAAKDEQVRSHVLAHELTHYRHCDHIWSVLRSACLVLHWYNPLVWLAAKVSRADAELACDEGALKKLGESQRSDYGRTLIGLTCVDRGGSLFVTATTMTGSAGSIRERIKLLMKRPRNTVLTLTAVILLVTVIVGCTFSGAPETTQPTETTEPTGHASEDDQTQKDLPYALAMEQAMADYADNNPRKLTSEEITQAREGLASTVYNAERDEYSATAVAAFFTSYYDDVSELDLAEFLRYFPTSGGATEEEFQLLRQKYGADFDWAEYESLQDMPVPVHRYEISDIDAVLRRYANLPFAEIQNKDAVYHLEETDSYYNFTSDFGPGAFICVDGFVYDGGAVLYSNGAALFLTETLGNYTIQAHLPIADSNVYNDMSYTGQELAIPENPTFLNSDGLLVFPGTRWGMTEEELLEALDIQEYGIFSGLRGIHLPDTSFCGYPASIAFLFEQYRSTDEWGLTGVRVQLQDEEAANAVYNILYDQLGRFDFQASGVAYTAWWSDAKLEDLISPEAWAVYQDEYPSYISEGQDADHIAASSVTWFGDSVPGQETMVSFSSGLHLARQIEAAIAPDQTAEVAALFGAGGDPWYLAALTTQYADEYSFDAVKFFSAGQSAVALTVTEQKLITAHYGKEALEHTIFRMTYERAGQVLNTYIGTDPSVMDPSEFLFCPETESYLLVSEEVPQLRRPEILSCEQLAENQVRMIYRFPGEEQRYCATLLKGETWKVYSNHYLLEKPQDAQELTEEQVAMFRAGFAPSIYNAATDTNYANPLACFTHSMYADIREMSKFYFLAYFPTEQEGTQEEFELLKAKYPDYFEDWTWETLPFPIHRYDADALEEFMMEYAGISFRDLPDVPWVHYLEETDSYYNYTSDSGLLGFPCTGGWFYDGGAVLYTDFLGSALILTERGGRYYIQAHLPALIAP